MNSGKIRVRVFDSAKPDSAEWLSVDAPTARTGEGLQVVKISVPPGSSSPTDVWKTDTVQVDLLDEKGAVVATAKQDFKASWVRPK